jgi:hypothetical protein
LRGNYRGVKDLTLSRLGRSIGGGFDRAGMDPRSRCDAMPSEADMIAGSEGRESHTPGNVMPGHERSFCVAECQGAEHRQGGRSGAVAGINPDGGQPDRDIRNAAPRTLR